MTYRCEWRFESRSSSLLLLTRCATMRYKICVLLLFLGQCTINNNCCIDIRQHVIIQADPFERRRRRRHHHITSAVWHTLFQSTDLSYDFIMQMRCLSLCCFASPAPRRHRLCSMHRFSVKMCTFSYMID